MRAPADSRSLLAGFIASIQAAVFNWGGLMACRFFLGVAEAAYGPGVPLYLTYFYPREKVGFRHGVFIAGAAMGAFLNHDRIESFEV